MEYWSIGFPDKPILYYSNSFTFMPTESVNLDVHALTPDRQVDRLKEQYLRLRGTNSEVRARRRAAGAVVCFDVGARLSRFT